MLQIFGYTFFQQGKEYVSNIKGAKAAEFIVIRALFILFRLS